MNRKSFLQYTGILTAGLAARDFSWAQPTQFPVVRVPEGQRNFKSVAIENAIKKFRSTVKNKELGWLFENCFPNTLDTTVFYAERAGRPDTYVITGDIDAMWLRDSSAQVFPYLPFTKSDTALHKLIAGVINKQVHFILKDPYANAFYNDDTKVSEWKETDITEMKPGVHERKWEIDSLCYPIRLAYHFWKQTGDNTPFDAAWKESVSLTLKTFREQQRKDGQGPYSFQRKTSWATDGVPLSGYGYPVKPNGLICSMFRPSDDATIFAYLVPSNFFAVVSLRQAAEMVNTIHHDAALAANLNNLAQEVSTALSRHAIVRHPVFGNMYAYEINGYGSHVFMDDTNVPSLLSMPYLDAVAKTDPIYLNTRKYIWSDAHPFYFKGKAGAAIGSPHTGADMIWPMSTIVKGLTATSGEEIKNCIMDVLRTHGNTGFVHESFHKDDPKKYTRKWFAWANTLYGELLWKTFNEKPYLLT